MNLLDAKGPLYGREAEYRTIWESIDQVAHGKSARLGRVVLLSGMSGVGKTALADAVIDQAIFTGFDVYRTACEPFHQGMSFFPIREIVRQVSGKRSVGSTVAEMFGDDSPQAEMAAVSESLSADPSSRREALVATFANVILGQFQQPDARPILVFIDDLEHLDTGSADALICLVSRLGEGKVLLFGAYRRDLVNSDHHPLKPLIYSSRRMEGVLLEVALDGFDRVRFNSFVNVLLPGNADLPASFYDMLFGETEGNPLFTREVLRMLSARKLDGTPGPLELRDGTWRFDGDVEGWDVPKTVEDVIASRLAFLDPEERHKLEIASVIGRRFGFEVFSGIMKGKEDELLENLGRFVDFDLIRELLEDHENFEFSHGKIHKVLYNSLIFLKRRKVHAQVAAVLSELMTATSDDWDYRIGDHYFKAGKHPDAFPYLLRAARRASATGLENEAVSSYDKALKAAAAPGAVFENDDSRQSIQLELAEALITACETDKAREVLDELTRSGIPDRIRMRAFNLLGDVLLFERDIQQAISTYQQGKDLAVRLGDDIALCEVLCDLSELHGRQYESLAGINSAKAAEHREAHIMSTEEAYRRMPNGASGQLRARILRNKAKLSRVSGDLPEAEALYLESINSVDSRVYGHRFRIPYVKTLRRLGRTTEALDILNRISSWSQQVNARRSQAIAAHWRGMVLMTIADTPEQFAAARTEALHALRTHIDLDYKQGIHEAQMILGEIALHMEDRAEAFDQFSASVGKEDLSFSKLLEIVAGELEANGEEDRAEFVRGWEQRMRTES